MPSERKIRKVVSFWRLLDSEAEPLDAVDWQQQLSRIASSAPDGRHVGGVVGNISRHSDSLRLVLSRDRGTAPRQRQQGTGRTSPLRPTGADWDVIEESFVSFLDIGNVFALVRSSIAAPPAAAVGEFLNATRIPAGIAWQTEPLIDHQRWQRVRETRQVLWVDLVAQPAKLVESNSSLIRSILELRDFGSVKVEIKISTGRGRANTQTRQNLRGEAADILDQVTANDESIEKAVVKVPGEPDPIDLIHHHITSKREITVQVGDLDRSLREDLVFNLIDGVTHEHWETIRKAVEGE